MMGGEGAKKTRKMGKKYINTEPVMSKYWNTSNFKHRITHHTGRKKKQILEAHRNRCFIWSNSLEHGPVICQMVPSH
jgi:hypothetical protein